MQKPPRHTQWGSLVWLTLHANSFGGRQATDNTSVRRTTWRVTWCLYQPFSPEHQQRFGCQESFITTCFWPLLCNQHHLLMCAHYTFCFLPPSFPSFLLLLLLFYRGLKRTYKHEIASESAVQRLCKAVKFHVVWAGEPFVWVWSIRRDWSWGVPL